MSADPVPSPTQSRLERVLRGSQVVTSSPDAVVRSRADPSSGETAYIACLRSQDRRRYLGVSLSGDLAAPIFSIGNLANFALAGDYVAFTAYSEDDYHGEILNTSSDIEVVNLSTGQSLNVSPNVDLPYGSTPEPGFGFVLAVSVDGSAAWETTVQHPAATGQSGEQETIYAHYAQGTRTLDTETVPSGSALGLGNLKIVGDQVTWTRDGQTVSATLRH